MQKLTFIILAGLIFFFVDLYVFQAIRTVTGNFSEQWQLFVLWFYWLWCFLSGSAFLLATIQGTKPRSNFKTYVISFLTIIFGSSLLVILFLLLDDGIRLIKYASAAWSENPGITYAQFSAVPRIKELSAIGLIAGTIPFISLVYGMVHGAFNFQVKKVKLKFPNLPDGFHGFKFLQISDLHTGSFPTSKALEKAVAIINKQGAEAVFFTGDLVNNVAAEVEPHLQTLGSIRAPMGVFSILGNHDYGDYVSWASRSDKMENLVHLKSLQARMGWHLLLNSHVKLERNQHYIALLGVENWGAKAGFPKYGKMYKAYAGTEHQTFRILLSHDPSHWEGEILEKYPDIDLMLSGHTHAMQFGLNLPGLKWSPVQFVYKQWSGLYKKGAQYLYVNVGLGFIGYPGRVGFLPEITVFELEKA